MDWNSDIFQSVFFSKEGATKPYNRDALPPSNNATRELSRAKSNESRK